MFKITSEEIDYSEKILLPSGEVFNDERRKVIQCLESKDIIACPGSGKTTTLLAKLVIVAKQLPLNNNKGVCVLTHTNVAINEIIERLGEKASILFNYPNHFGTIQSFVDKYLAIPAYAHYYKKRPTRIDNEVYYEQVEKRFGDISYPAKTWLTHQRDYWEKLKNIRFSTEDFSNLLLGLDGETFIQNRNGSAFKGLYDFKVSLLNSGILCFDDAYSIAHRYLRDFPQLRNIFSERFAIVLVDEMQDTDKHQDDLLNKIFDKRVIIQKIGDNNQAIFHSSVKDNIWNINSSCLTIRNSKRFSNSIARIVNKICLVPHDNLSGDDNIHEIKPKLLIFNDSSINKVLPTFGDIIIKHNLQEDRRKLFKAVGWIARPNENGKHTIQSYYGNYSRPEQYQKIDFDYLSSYLKTQNDNLIGKEGANYYRKAIIRAILKCLRILEVKTQENRFFQERTLYKHLEENNCEILLILKLKLAQWCLNIHRGLNVTQEVKGFIVNELCRFFNVTNLEKIIQFFDTNPTESENEPVAIMPNIYKHCSNGIEIDIHISTVHGVKGETHTASLYLETFYYQYDVLRIIEYLKGNYSKPTSSRVKYNLKIAHVGMSRPTHLLCVAVHEVSIDRHLKELEEFGWDIIKISETNT